MEPEVPCLDFPPLQNALQSLGTSDDSLETGYRKKLETNTVDY